MTTTLSHDFASHFSDVEDPRIDRGKAHQLIDILFISVAGTIAGCDGPSDIAEFARAQLAWCRRFVPLENGVPAHDTIGRVLSLIKPREFQKAFVDWITSFVNGDNDGGPRFIPIDGKTLRGSRGAKHRKNPLHLVSAWATQQGMTLGQVAVDSKSNEITAIPKLLEMLELKGAIISIDAMGCQKKSRRRSSTAAATTCSRSKTISFCFAKRFRSSFWNAMNITIFASMVVDNIQPKNDRAADKRLVIISSRRCRNR